jgi:glycosyltransferase involved in cell wall biosynthesis
MRNILVDLHRLGGNSYNGLYHFSYALGKELYKLQNPNSILHFYVPTAQVGIFGNNATYATQKSRDKLYKFGTSQFDVWHAATTLSWYKPFNPKTKFIFTIHDLNFVNEEEYTVASQKKYLRLIQQRVNRADHITFISQFAKQQAEQLLQLHNTPNSVIYNGCTILLPQNATMPNYIPQKPFLFTIGQLHSRKNFHVLAALLQNNDLELIIAGYKETAYAKKVLDFAQQYNVTNRVHLIGTIEEGAKIWYYENCKAFVFPSVGEGFGLPVLEAMQFGKPVFLSKETSLPEIGGSAAYYFDNFDAATMHQNFIAGMQHYENKLPIEKIKAQAAKFSYATAAQEYLHLYQTI